MKTETPECQYTYKNWKVNMLLGKLLHPQGTMHAC